CFDDERDHAAGQRAGHPVKHVIGNERQTHQCVRGKIQPNERRRCHPPDQRPHPEPWLAHDAILLHRLERSSVRRSLVSASYNFTPFTAPGSQRRGGYPVILAPSTKAAEAALLQRVKLLKRALE